MDDQNSQSEHDNDIGDDTDQEDDKASDTNMSEDEDKPQKAGKNGPGPMD